ncbi:MAG: copper transporter [Nocardioides sp.]|uniref:copper transporter n=1 Tax=Nocardioides sp. TaxID=35761 RepID=UPI0039E697BA
MRRLLGLIALVLALAIGIALGAGPLGDRLNDELGTDRAASRSHDPGDTGGADDGTVGAADSDPLDAALLQALAPAALAGRLTGQSVAIVAMPGADSGALETIAADVASAGGAVTSTTTLTTALTDGDGKQLVDALGSQLAAQVPGVVDGSLTTYPRMGALLGVALTTKAAQGAPGAEASTIRDTLATGKLVEAPIAGDVATLTLLVTGNGTHDAEAAIVTGLTSGLLGQAHGLVIAGDTSDADVAAVRDAALPVGTYDGLDSAAGPIATVLLLARQTTAPGGSYGASGSDGSVPAG